MNEEKKVNATSYNANPSYYEAKFRKTFEEYAQPDLERFLSELNGSRILDAGCGPGIYLEYFREKGLDALGIDLSEAFLERCAEKGLNVRKMDMENPLLYPYSFDGIWCLALVHTPRERIPALAKTWAKLLKPNGVLFISAKKGVSEGYEPSETGDNTRRWFTYFEEGELQKYFSPYFDVIHSYTRTIGTREWVVCFFRVKSGALKTMFRNF